MITIKIPGWRDLNIEAVLLDFNGTLAVDGVLIDGVAERLKALSEQAKLIVLTADTFGSASEQLADLPVEVRTIDPGSEAMSKRFAVDDFGTVSTAYIGNGANDEKALSSCSLGIAVLGLEGLFGHTMQAADIVVSSPLDALDLLLKPKRLIAGLRR
ncbi:ATPase P [bacterium]|nr:ATPase P [bacterium]